MLYTEIGIGNPSLVSSEIEFADGSEIRIRGRVPFKINFLCIYLRFWFGKRVAVIDRRGFHVKNKNRAGFKILIGASSS